MSTRKLETKAEHDARPTIVLITDQFVYDYQANVGVGVFDTAAARDVNLLCFVGGRLCSFDGFEAQGNIIYDLANVDNVDGLLVMTSVVSSHVGPEETKVFCEAFRPLPLVSIGLIMEGFPSLVVDNETGLRDALVHLVEDHAYRRIAFIRGPEANEEADLRYQTYTTVLAEHGLSIDPDLVAPGDFLRPSGGAAVSLLLDERKVDFDAVVAANDNMALGALEALQARGVRVPHDVAVVGFDDVPETRFVDPPMTTVRQLQYKLGQQATDMLLALLAGDEVPEQVTLPTEAVIRQSCGCLSPTMLHVEPEQPARGKDQALKTALAKQREDILSEMVQTAGTGSAGFSSEQANRLLDAFVGELEEGPPDSFLSALDAIVGQTAAAGGDVAIWQEPLAKLHHRLQPLLGEETSLRAESLWRGARALIGEMAHRVQGYRALQADQQARTLWQVGAALITTHSMKELADVLTEGLPRVGIPSVYLSLYEEPQPYQYPMPAPEWSRLVLAYAQSGSERIALGAEGRRFRSHQLVPEGLLPQGRRYSLVVRPLFFRESQTGFILFEMLQRNLTICETLSTQISSALQRMGILDDLERRALQLQTAAEVSRAAGSLLDLDALIQQVVDLVQERFDLYYVGLFLVDELGRWAELRAGTGEAGQQMLAQRHRLEVGGTSMIGDCVANKQPRVALDVGEEAVRFDNPFLPDTRSELALPLVSRDEAMGALTIQSAQEAAFSDEDIAVFQIMADQLANAITNARLFLQTQAALTEMERVQRQYLERAWGEFAQVRGVVGYEQTPEGVVPTGDEMLPGVEQALEELGSVVMDGTDGTSVLTVPILLRGQPLGAMGFRFDKKARDVNPDDIALIEGIGEQFALAAENLRLLDETQRRAARERITSEVASRFRESLDLERVLQTATEDIYQTLGLERVVVRLEMSQDGVGREGSTTSGGDTGTSQEEAV